MSLARCLSCEMACVLHTRGWSDRNLNPTRGNVPGKVLELWDGLLRIYTHGVDQIGILTRPEAMSLARCLSCEMACVRSYTQGVDEEAPAPDQGHCLWLGAWAVRWPALETTHKANTQHGCTGRHITQLNYNCRLQLRRVSSVACLPPPRRMRGSRFAQPPRNALFRK